MLWLGLLSLPFALLFPPLLLVSLIFFLLARQKDKEWKNRSFGVRFEAKTIKTLTHNLPKDWTGKKDLPVPGHGNLDYLVYTNQGKYAIEIKSFTGLIKKGDYVEKTKGTPLKKDPIQQVITTSRYYHANAILWLPQAYAPPFFCRDVLVVQGTSKTLIKEIYKLEKVYA